MGEIGVRLSPEGINDFVLSGLFKSWPNKTERRNARQDHKLATTYYNRLLLIAHEDGDAVFPLGSMAINEEDLDGDNLTDGYSLVVKIDAAPDPVSWLWWQARVPDLEAPVAFAPAHPDCERCHSGGLDRILANKFPDS